MLSRITTGCLLILILFPRSICHWKNLALGNLTFTIFTGREKAHDLINFLRTLVRNQKPWLATLSIFRPEASLRLAKGGLGVRGVGRSICSTKSESDYFFDAHNCHLGGLVSPFWHPWRQRAPDVPARCGYTRTWPNLFLQLAVRYWVSSISMSDFKNRPCSSG